MFFFINIKKWGSDTHSFYIYTFWLESRPWYLHDKLCSKTTLWNEMERILNWFFYFKSYTKILGSIMLVYVTVRNLATSWATMVLFFRLLLTLKIYPEVHGSIRKSLISLKKRENINKLELLKQSTIQVWEKVVYRTINE